MSDDKRNTFAVTLFEGLQFGPERQYTSHEVALMAQGALTVLRMLQRGHSIADVNAMVADFVDHITELYGPVDQQTPGG